MSVTEEPGKVSTSINGHKQISHLLLIICVVCVCVCMCVCVFVFVCVYICMYVYVFICAVWVCVYSSVQRLQYPF